MPIALAAVIGFIISGLVWRVLASIGFSLATAHFINKVIDEYLLRSIEQMNTSLPPTTSAFLNLIGADDCISIMIGGLTFVATYKSLKLIFIRK